jgi:hypothetical protein
MYVLGLQYDCSITILALHFALNFFVFPHHNLFLLLGPLKIVANQQLKQSTTKPQISKTTKQQSNKTTQLSYKIEIEQ